MILFIEIDEHIPESMFNNQAILICHETTKNISAYKRTKRSQIIVQFNKILLKHLGIRGKNICFKSRQKM